MDELLVPEGLTDVKPIREIIYEYLRQAILDGLFKPGDRLVERDIAEKLNASRTPVREALRKLESEGFVTYLTRKGMVVKGVNLDEIDEIYSIRKELECLSIRYAIKNITEEQVAELRRIVAALDRGEQGDDTEHTAMKLHDFDDLILSAANAPTLAAFLRSLYDTLKRYKQLNLSAKPRRTEAVGEHKEILQAIIDRDEQRAETLVRLHVDHSRQELHKRIKETVQQATV